MTENTSQAERQAATVRFGSDHQLSSNVLADVSTTMTCLRALDRRAARAEGAA